jgi:hypothetical protein
MSRQPEEPWMRFDREAFEIDLTLQKYARRALPGEMEALGVDPTGSDWVVLVDAIVPGYRNRKFVQQRKGMADILEQQGGMHFCA